MSEKKKGRNGERKLALYHVIYTHEGFEESAKKFFGLIRYTQERHPGEGRYLFLDIDDHRDSAGNFDSDMMALKDFLLVLLLPFLTEISSPFGTFRNPGPQNNDVPKELKAQV